MMRIYVASSWRNPWQPGVVSILQNLGHKVYDFREPTPGARGFHWSDIDGGWQGWSPEQYRSALNSPIAIEGFESDMRGLRECDACVAVQPHGTSTAMEIGWATGAGKKTAVLFPKDVPITPIGGHAVSGESHCTPCHGPFTRNSIGCLLPGKLSKVEPELMAKMAGEILVSKRELVEWVNMIDARELTR